MSSAKTRKLIVDAARRLFAVRGFRDITIGDIAVAAQRKTDGVQPLQE